MKMSKKKTAAPAIKGMLLYRIVLIFRGSKFSRIAVLKEFVE